MSARFLARLARSKAATNDAARKLSAPEIKKLIDNLQEALNNSKKREAEKAAGVKKLASLMAKMEISAADLKKLAGVKPKRKAVGKKVAPKYQIKVGKNTHKWTGRGRMPLVFKEFAEKNGSLDKCLIK